MKTIKPYLMHLKSGNDLVTSYEATRAGFVALALEKNRRSTPYVNEARALFEAASPAKKPKDLLKIGAIRAGLLTAAGLSDKARGHLLAADETAALNGLIKNFLEPAGPKFVEELVYRFLLIRGDTLGGSMRNIGGALAQSSLSRTIISTLNLSGTDYRWMDSKTKKWVRKAGDEPEIEYSLRALSWETAGKPRTLVFNFTVPFIENNVDMCLFNESPNALSENRGTRLSSYIALGELKGGIDPAGADEHWKTAVAALNRIRKAFSKKLTRPAIFFIGAAIEKKMAGEIWTDLKSGTLDNAANLTVPKQLTSISRWLCSL